MTEAVVTRTSLRRKVMGAAGWTVGQTGAQYIMRLCSNLIMTRLLLPEAFGLLGFAVTVISALSLFTDIGITQSIVREKDGEEPHFLRVAWTAKVVRSVVISVVVVLVAGLIAVLAPIYAPHDTVYADTRLPLLVALTSIATMMQGLESANKELAVRRMAYRRFSTITIIAHALSIITMISFALISPTVWALLAGMLSFNVYLTTLSHIAFPQPRMRFEWDPEIAHRLWDFGKWIILSSTFAFVQQSGDKLLLGALLTASVFGLYVIAQVWTSLVRTVVTMLCESVGFPAVSEVVRDRPENFPTVYRRFQNGIDAICVAGFLGLFFGSKILLTLLYTAKYHAAAHYISLLSISILTARFESYTFLLASLGNSRATTITSATRALSLCVLLPLASWIGGVDAVVLVVAIIPVLSAPYALSVLRPHLGHDQVRTEWLALAASLICAAGAFVVVRTWL